MAQLQTLWRPAAGRVRVSKRSLSLTASSLATCQSSLLSRHRTNRIKYIDPKTHKRLVFLTNQFVLPALSIADLYRCRWQVEIFFKWTGQHLCIKAFFGTSENAVKTQIWIAISDYVLVAIVKKRLNLPRSLYENLPILCLTLCEQMPRMSYLRKVTAIKIRPKRITR